MTPATPAVTAPPAAAPDPVALQKQIDDLKAENAEKDRATQFWHEKATKGEPAKGKATEEEPEEDILETLTTKGAKGLDAVLAKRGYVRGEDVDKRVNDKAASMVKEQQLVDQYPDLKKKDSEFFKATAIAYGDLVKQGVAPGVAMEMAAERTELKFMRDGKIKTPSEQKAEREAARRTRVAAQGAEGTGRTPAHTEEEDEDLTPEQLRIVNSMLVGSQGADGKPMTEAQAVEVYKARAKKGVAMKGLR